ncbi:MAG TPA: CPBP family intramembrane metalloprotease [Deltaproteobacteria bacterium]|nr:CPBP family intramembrane metalloprotease [Deltaproteobacteria bacterium]
MITERGGMRLVWSLAALACALWFVTFALGGVNFWIKIAISAFILAAAAVWAHTPRFNTLRFDRTAVLQGVVSAVALYIVFWFGKEISALLFPFAPRQVDAIYGKGAGFPIPAIVIILLFITGPCEEIFWRGFLQRRLMARYGRWTGWLVATGVYAGVHVWSLNFMLVGAAAVAGAFWGLMYLRFDRLDGLIISHSLWSACIFAFVPMGR